MEAFNKQPTLVVGTSEGYFSLYQQNKGSWQFFSVQSTEPNMQKTPNPYLHISHAF